MRERVSNPAGRTARWLALATLVIAASACDGDGPSGPSNNRECSVATPTGTIVLGQTINGALSNTDCRAPDGTYADLYRLNISTATNVQITLTSTAFDAYLLILDSDGEVLAEDDDSAGGTNALLAGQLSPGTYYVAANSFDLGETGAYQLTVQ